jgi:hypothetical protein
MVKMIRAAPARDLARSVRWSPGGNAFDLRRAAGDCADCPATAPKAEEEPKVKITEVENRFSQFGRIRLLTFCRYFRDIVVDGGG